MGGAYCYGSLPSLTRYYTADIAVKENYNDSEKSSFYCDLLSGVSSGAACAQQNCPPNPVLPYALPQNVNITTVIDSASTPCGTNSAQNRTAVQAVWDGVGSVSYDGTNVNGTNTTFSTVDSSSNHGSASSPVVTIVFDNTTNDPTGPNGEGEAVGAYKANYNSSGVITSATVTVYLNLQQCGGACFNPSKPGYADAVSSTVQHELTHLLGIGDADVNNSTNGNTLMGTYFGVNNTGVEDDGTQLYSNNNGSLQALQLGASRSLLKKDVVAGFLRGSTLVGLCCGVRTGPD